MSKLLCLIVSLHQKSSKGAVLVILKVCSLSDFFQGCLSIGSNLLVKQRAGYHKNIWKSFCLQERFMRGPFGVFDRFRRNKRITKVWLFFLTIAKKA